MPSLFSRYVRPYGEKLAGLHPGRLPSFLRQMAALTDEPAARWVPKMLWGMARGFQQHEFRFYRVHALSWRMMATYHSTIDNVRLIERLNAAESLPLLRDKGVFLKRFAHRAGRGWLDLREAGVGKFRMFLEKHPRFLAKAYNLALGAGIEVFDEAPEGDAVAALHARLVREEKFVIEEFIQQHAALGRVYDRSVNTLRIYTLSGPGGVATLFPPIMRFGSAGGRIDSSGIITGLVDGATGAWICGGVNRKGAPIESHPDTGFVFSELVVPRMAEAVALVEAAALEIPEVRYIGWDVAITERGPVLVEGNGAPGVVTLQWLLARRDAEGRGCRSVLAALK